MPAGDEQTQSLESSASTHTLTVLGRNVGAQAVEVIASTVVNKKIDALSAAHRSGLAAADTGSLASAAGSRDVGNSSYVEVHGRCNTASAGLTFALALYDEAGTLIGVTESQSISADASWTDGTLYLAPRVLVDVAVASQVRVIVQAITGTWTVYVEGL